MGVRAAVVIEKLLRDVIPEDVAIQKETLDWVSDCATGAVNTHAAYAAPSADVLNRVDLYGYVVSLVFLQLVGSTANDIAESGAKKENYRISSDHVVQALEKLGKRVYVDQVREQQDSQSEQTQKKRQRVGSKKADAASHEELLAAQNALFKQASLKATKEGW